MYREMLLKRKTTGIFIYTIGAVIVFIIGVTIFSIAERNTEFAIAVFGSLVGGFLGALLASIVVIDMYKSTKGMGG